MAGGAPKGPSSIFLIGYPGERSVELRFSDSLVAAAQAGQENMQAKIAIAYRKTIGREAYAEWRKLSITKVRSAQ